MSRKTQCLRFVALVSVTWLSGCETDRTALSPASPPALTADKTSGIMMSSDPRGQIATVSTSGSIDRSNAFFQSLGTNGRSCATCHLQSDGMGLSPTSVQAVFSIVT